MTLNATIVADFEIVVPDGKKPRSGFAILACLAKDNGYSGNSAVIKPLWDSLPPALQLRFKNVAKQFNKDHPRASGKRGTSNYNLFAKAVKAAFGNKLTDKLRLYLPIVWKTVTDGEKKLWRSCAKGNAPVDDMKQFITINANAKKPIIVAPVVFEEDADEDADAEMEEEDEE